MSDVLLPPNATPQELAMEQASARVGDVPTPVRDVWNPDTCPAALLPWLAWAYSVDNWDATWTPAQQRDSIRASVDVHRYKGTIGAVRDALDALGFTVVIQEWFNKLPEGEPYTFDVILTTDQIGIDQSAMAKILRVIEGTKNLRSHISTIRPTIKTASNIFIGGVMGMGSDLTISFGGYTLMLNGTFVLDGSQTLSGFRL